MTDPVIRPYRAADREAVARICLLSGDGGADARGRFGDDALLPLAHVLPYLALEPEHALVLDGNDGLLGYIVGAADTRAHVAAYRARWIPELRRLGYAPPPLDPADPVALAAASPGERLRLLAFTPEYKLVAEHPDYPAHLHLDLLPAARRQGHGSRMVRRLLGMLAAAGAPRAHVVFDGDDARCRGFYARLGFRPLPSAAGSASPAGLELAPDAGPAVRPSGIPASRTARNR